MIEAGKRSGETVVRRLGNWTTSGVVPRLGFEEASSIRKELLMALRVILAAYGALRRGGNQDNTEAADVTGRPSAGRSTTVLTVTES